MSALIKFIKAENAKSQAWMDEVEGRIAGMLSEDAAWWDERDVRTVKDFERWEYTATISDLAKDAYGTRSACPDVSDMPLEELKATYESMVDDLRETQEHEASMQEAAIVRFENKIAELITIGAGDRENAIQWLKDAEEDEDVSNDIGYFEYTYGIPYGYVKSGGADAQI